MEAADLLHRDLTVKDRRPRGFMLQSVTLIFTGIVLPYLKTLGSLCACVSFTGCRTPLHVVEERERAGTSRSSHAGVFMVDRHDDRVLGRQPRRCGSSR